MFSLLSLEERNGILVIKGKKLERDTLVSFCRASLATRITLVCFWKLKFYRNRKKMHTYMNEKIYFHHHSLLSILQSLKAVTILLSQRLKPRSQFKFSILLSGSLLGYAFFQVLLGNSTWDWVHNRALLNCQFVFLCCLCNESVTVTQLEIRVNLMTHEMCLWNNKDANYAS